MKRLLFAGIVMLCIPFTPLPGQDLSPSVMGAGGGFASHPVMGTLHWTIGEVATERLGNSYLLDQGFHRSSEGIKVSVNPGFLPDGSIRLVPNPTVDAVRILLPYWEQGMAVDVLDVAGRILASHNLASMQDELNLQQAPPGSYILLIRDRHKFLGAAQLVIMHR